MPFPVQITKPKVHNQQCPICGRLSKVWMDQYDTPNYEGCLHVSDAVIIGGTLQLEFAVK